MSSDQQIVFHLSPDEHKRMRKLVSTVTTSLPPWWYVIMSVLYGSQLILLSSRLEKLISGIYLLLFVLWLFMAIKASRTGFRRLPVDGSLHVSSDGFSGTLDNEPATIHWSDIENVRDFGDAIVLFRRRNRSPIAVPKADIADIATLWALLEDRLISKRGLILSAAPRSQISNSAY